MSDASGQDAPADSATKSCGLIMPIAECDGCGPAHWLEVQSIIVGAVSAISDPIFNTKMVSDGDAAGTIHGRIVRNVWSNEIVVCDVSGRNPNVLFELGLRIAFDRPVVLIKDDITAFAFDIGPLEHIMYPRSLRHAPMEQFKADLARKVAATYKDWYSSTGERPSYIKAFGPITTVEFDRTTEKADHAILDAIAGLGRRIDAMEIARTTPEPALVRIPPWRQKPEPHQGSLILNELPKTTQVKLQSLVREKIAKDGKVDAAFVHRQLAALDDGRIYTKSQAADLLNYMVLSEL